GDILAKQPNNIEARFRKAYCHIVIGEHKNAATEYKEAARFAQNECQRAVANALFHTCTGDYDRCRRELESAKANYAGSFLVLHNLGETCKIMGNLEEAESNFLEAVRVNPSDGWSRMMLAEVIRTKRVTREAESAKRSRYETAMEHYKESMRDKDPI